MNFEINSKLKIENSKLHKKIPQNADGCKRKESGSGNFEL
jgi:hypothetical protein